MLVSTLVGARKKCHGVVLQLLLVNNLIQYCTQRGLRHLVCLVSE